MEAEKTEKLNGEKKHANFLVWAGWPEIIGCQGSTVLFHSQTKEQYKDSARDSMRTVWRQNGLSPLFPLKLNEQACRGCMGHRRKSELEYSRQRRDRGDLFLLPCIPLTPEQNIQMSSYTNSSFIDSNRVWVLTRWVVPVSGHGQVWRFPIHERCNLSHPQERTL